MEKYLYRTYFDLSDNIPDEHWMEARKYLDEDNMANYLPDELSEKIILIQYDLITNNKGFINIISNVLLTQEELIALKDELDGQNSDGLGEGFEQQEFAELHNSEDEDDYTCIYIEDNVDVPSLIKV
jgi:hypothetical protein